MEHILLIISLSSLLFSFSAEAICLPRNFTYLNPSPAPYSPPQLQPATPVPSPTSPISSPPTVSSPPSLSTPVDPIIKKICDTTDDPLLCISSIIPYLIIRGTIDPVSVLEMEIKACTHNTELALAEATRIANDPSTPSTKAIYLDTCMESYSDAIDNLKSATSAIQAHDIGTLNSMLSAALTDFMTCEDGFDETPGSDSPMAEVDDTLHNLASNCLAIATLLH